MNCVKLTGVLVSEWEFSHETHKEKLYIGYISTQRFSGYEDIVPITVPERVLNDIARVGQRLTIEGEFRSYNKIIDGKTRLILSVFALLVNPPAFFITSWTLSSILIS